MKKNIVYLLLILILFHMGIFYPLFFLRKAEIKREVRNRILQSDEHQGMQETVVLILSPSEFEKLRWIEKGREFLFLGKMFDIISLKKDLHGNIKIIALEDGKEMALYQILKHRHNAAGGKFSLINQTIQYSLYFIPAAIHINLLPSKQLVLGEYKVCPPLQFEPGVPSPPPWFT